MVRRRRGVITRHISVALSAALVCGTGCAATADTGEETGAESTTEATTATGEDASGGGEGGEGGEGTGSAGCGTDPSGVELTLEVNGQGRAFQLYIPADYDPARAYPLVYGLHGGGGTADAFRSYAGLEEAAGSEAIVVYPEGLPEPGTTTQLWNLDPDGDDFVFFDELLAHLSDSLCIDEARVFATGWSLGGYMANGVGCYRADTFRAIASCSGGTPGPKPGLTPFPPCEGQIPALIIHGSGDSVIPLSEGTTIRDTFVENNGCDATTAAVAPSPCEAYDGCDEPTRWCEFSGGHEWPDFARTAVWDFFRDQ